MASTSPRLHVLKLHESPVVDGDYSRFDMVWVIDDGSPPGNSGEEFGGINTGDVLYFPELLSGAGEFEGTRIVGTRIDQGLPLLRCGIEGPEFSQEILALSEGSDLTLRELYSRPFDSILEEQGFSLLDLIGGAEDMDSFWANPTLQRRPSREPDGTNIWLIPLGSCSLVSSESNG